MVLIDMCVILWASHVPTQTSQTNFLDGMSGQGGLFVYDTDGLSYIQFSNPSRLMLHDQGSASWSAVFSMLC